jgi:hypothetical protein
MGGGIGLFPCQWGYKVINSFSPFIFVKSIFFIREMFDWAGPKHFTERGEVGPVYVITLTVWKMEHFSFYFFFKLLKAPGGFLTRDMTVWCYRCLISLFGAFGFQKFLWMPLSSLPIDFRPSCCRSQCAKDCFHYLTIALHLALLR